MTGDPIDERPLFGPDGRIPVAATELRPVPRGFAAVRAGWTRRHSLLAAAAAAVMFGVFRGASGPVATGLGWQSALVVAGLLAGFLVALYLPLRGLPREPVSACFVMPVAVILAAGVLLGSGATPFTVAVALALLGFGAVRRTISLNAC